MNMNFNPPLKRNGVEVTSIVPAVRTINFVVHAGGTAAEAMSNTGRHQINRAVRDMVRYLEMEGYIPPKQNWLTHMGVILHAAGENGTVKLKDY